jgi:hypothetical protein
MNSVTIQIVVEGQTEQTFIREVLAPQMGIKGIFLTAALIGKPGKKGGDIRFDRATTDILNFLNQREDTFVSTMFDYFRIDSKWPGIGEVDKRLGSGAVLSATEKANIVETAMDYEVATLLNHSQKGRFIPYIGMHEFEALLFSNIEILAEKTKIDLSEIRKITEEYDNSPEEINSDPVKAPSKRLDELKHGYRKVAMGKTVSEAIGIQAIRRQCPHFNSWLTNLENLKNRDFV